MNLTNVVAVFLGAGFGGVLRYVAGELASQRWPMSFPAHTLAINVIGSFALGLIMALGAQREALSPGAILFLSVGVLGGFTTLSAVSYDSVAMFQQGQVLAAVTNMFGSILLGVTAAAFGVLFGRTL